MTSNTIYKSPAVSCLTCRKELSAKGIFSHFFSAHTEDGRESIKRAGKKGAYASHPVQQQNNKLARNTKEKEYLEIPNLCQHCSKSLAFESRNNKFCSHHCAAVNSNANRSQQSRSKQADTLRKNKKLIHDHPKKSLWKRTQKDISLYFSSEKLQYSKISQCVICHKFFPGTRKSCSTECYKKILSAIATANPKMGGNKNTRAFGWYTSKYAGKVWLESSYEYKVAKSLDENDVIWKRPSFMRYGNKKYFADFYLLDYDVYLDPKNDHLISTDTDKIRQAMLENNVTIHILNKHQLEWESIHKLLDVRLELT